MKGFFFKPLGKVEIFNAITIDCILRNSSKIQRFLGSCDFKFALDKIFIDNDDKNIKQAISEENYKKSFEKLLDERKITKKDDFHYEYKIK